ncbi:MAG: hypothetical protein FJ090_07870 [Deltaproteobacteria bacterium]|nr:hypothetical protein [Deltaproteobacteria bacterium]
MPDTRRVRLCMKDLYQQDLVEMIERETRNFEIFAIGTPSHPDFLPAYNLLLDEFGPEGGMERLESVRGFLLEDPYEPQPGGTYMRYFMLVAKNTRGELLGARDGVLLYNAEYDGELMVVFLSHIVMKEQARGTVLSYWLRIAPVELAVTYVAELAAMGKITLPLPDQPGKHFGMKLNLAAEMEYFTPEEPLSLQRILFYGRGGFDVVNPRYFPYKQPDFREPEVIRATGNQPVPFMMLLRRMGRERQATIPTTEAAAVMKLLYDDFATYCLPEFIGDQRQLVLDRLSERELRGQVELLPLPTGPRDIHRLRPIFRYNVFKKYYPNEPDTLAYLSSGIEQKVRKNPRYVDEEIARLAEELEMRERWVYPARDKDYDWMRRAGSLVKKRR